LRAESRFVQAYDWRLAGGVFNGNPTET